MIALSQTDASWRTDNIGRLLFAATDRCVAAKLRVVHRGGFEAISEAQMALFLNLDLAGTRLTTIAARASLTKQSMIELVDKAEALVLVERRPDPDDKRAKVVTLTPLGRTLLEKLHQGIVAAEHEVAQVVGCAFLLDLKRELRGYVAAPVATDDMACQAPPAGGDAAWRTDNVGRLFSLAARRFVRNVLHAVHERGYREVTEVLLALFRNLDLGGARLTAIASRARMTKQSMRELVDRAEALGFVERRGDPADGRAKVILFTAGGLVMLDELRQGVARAEADFSGLTSGDFCRAVKARLPDYIASVASDREDRAGREAWLPADDAARLAVEA